MPFERNPMSEHNHQGRLSRRLRKTPHLITAAALLFAVAPSYFAASANAAVPGNFSVVEDQNGVNDVSGQFDLTQFGRDDTDATYLKMFWSWDDPTFSGANTGDACALLDTGADGMVDISICTVVHTVKSGKTTTTVLDGDPVVSTCDNAWTDRCGHPAALAFVNGTDVIAGALTDTSAGNPNGIPDPSPPTDLVTATDPFPTGNAYKDDTTAEVYLTKAFLVGKHASLINVCSYPSSGAGASNNDPKDCIVNPGNGALVIVKDAGSNTTTDFPFTVDPGATAVKLTGSATSSPIPELVGSNVDVTETVPSGWLFHAVSCTLSGGGSTGTADVANKKITGITIEAGKTTTCTVEDISDAHISLTKTAKPTQFSAAGQAITYTLTATNDGNSPLTDVSITDTDSGVAINSPCTPAQPASLNPGDTLVCTASYTTTAANVTAGTFTNTGHVAGTAPDGSSQTDKNTATISLIGPALTLTKSALPTTYTDAGQTITYTLTATNSGNVDLKDVSITDTDLGVAISPDPCTVATLAVGDKLTCSATYSTIQADVTAGSFTNTANASGTDSVLNTTVHAVPATATVNLAQLSLTKTASPTTYDDAGVPIRYTLVATNSGQSVLNNVSITDGDVGVTLDPSPCTAGTLAIGATLTCHADYSTTTTDVTNKSFTNTAAVTGTSLSGATVRATKQATINLAHLKLTKVPSPTTYSSAGTLITYTLTATNDGNVPLTNVAISDPEPGVALDSTKCSPVQPVASLAVGATITCTATYTTTAADVAAGSVTNLASVDGTDPNRQAISASQGAVVTFVAPPPAPGQPNLTLVKSSLPAAGGTVQRGDSITYTLAYANTGTANASGTLASDPLPADTTFVSATAGGSYDAATNTVSWALGTISPGTSGSVSFVVQVANSATDGEVISNVGAISAAGVAPVSSNPVTLTVNVPATPTPTLDIAKQVDKTEAEFGDTLTYSFTVLAGGLGQTGVLVTDTIPDGTAYVPSSATCSIGCSASLSGGVLTWDVGNLAQGQSVDLSFKVTISTPQADANGGVPAETITNVGFVNSHQIVDPVASNKVKTNITAVLAIHHTRKPPTHVKGEHSPLPFTGLPLLQLMAMAIGAVGVGSLLVRAARSRRATVAGIEPPADE
jgi:uncharacterized repeat protein (TIGR01451 family)